MRVSSTSSSEAAFRRLLLACCALAVLCVLLYFSSQWLAGLIAEAAGPTLVRVSSGRVTDPGFFVAARIREAALLAGLAGGLLAATVGLCRALFSGLGMTARWACSAAVAVAAIHAWVVGATGTVLFWAALYFGGPNLMQSAYHFERLLAEESPAPVKAVVLGSSQGGSQIHGGELNDQFEPGAHVAILAYAGTEASEFPLEAELFAPLHPQVVIVYINESNFYQGVSGSRYLPFMTWKGLRHVLDSGARDLGASDGFFYAVVGLASPLFQVRRAVEFFVFGYAAANKEFPRGVSTASATALADRASRLAATYSISEQSEFQKREFLRFMAQQVERGATPLVLVGQVNPILEDQIPPVVRKDFRDYVADLAARYPKSVVLNDELPRHQPADYFPDDLMHVNHEARLVFTERVASLLEERFGWVRNKK